MNIILLNLSSIAAGISAVGVFVLGLIVLTRNIKAPLNKAFFGFTIGITIWLVATFEMLRNCINPNTAIFWDRMAYIGVAFIAVTMYHMSLVLRKKLGKQKIILFAGYFLAIVFLSLSHTSLFIDDLYIYNYGCHAKAQPLHNIFLSIFVFYVILFFINTILAYKNSINPVQKTQTKYFLLAFVIFSTGIVAFLPAYQIPIPPFTFIVEFIGVIIMAYAIIRHRLMDIRIVIKQGTVYIFSIITTLAFTFCILTGINYFTRISLNHYLLAIGSLLSLVVFEPTKKIFQKFANKYLFTSLYNYQATIRALSQELTTTIDFEKIISYLNQIMQETMHVEKMAVLVRDQNNAHYNAHKIFGFVKKEAAFWPIFSLVTEHLEKNQALIVQEEMDAENALAKKMKQNGLAIALPLSRGKKLIGVIILGDKISADSYSKQDIELLEVLANQASVAIENALLYKEVRDFTLHLKEKVAEQTEDIKKLYAVKNDFLHIVSHQLRTPLSALNGLVSLWTDKDYEAQTKEEKDKIKERVKISCDRLSNVTNRMLDTLNFEKGRIILKFEKIDLGKTIQETVEMLKPNFEKRGLYLKFTPLEKSFFINADPKYLSQVFQNLIDNAEKYTRQGGLTIQIRKSLKEAKIIFKDTGMGLEPEEKKYALHEKFFRGRGAKEQYTGGTGLGLYLVKQIIDGHHGKIEVASAGRDQGTEFIVTLPVNWKK